MTDPKAEILPDREGGYKVLFSHGQHQLVVPSLCSRHTARLACRLLSVKQAVDAGQQGVRTMISGGSSGLAPGLQIELEALSLSQLVRQLRECALEQRCPTEEIRRHGGRSLAHAAAYLGPTLLLRLLLALQPASAASAVDDGGRTPLYEACRGGQMEALELLLAAAPGTATQGRSNGVLPLHVAARHGHCAAVSRLLAHAPGTATARTSTPPCSTALHFAAARNHAAAVEVILMADPAAAAVANDDGSTPLHEAARGCGSPVVVERLLAAAPASASLADAGGRTPIQAALAGGRIAAARCLLGAGQAATVLAALQEAGPAVLPLFPELALARMPLSADEWAAVPAPCPGLGRALPAALARSDRQARLLVAHLPEAEAQALRTAALCLARMQAREQVELPLPIMRHLLALSIA